MKRKATMNHTLTTAELALLAWPPPAFAHCETEDIEPLPEPAFERQMRHRLDAVEAGIAAMTARELRGF